MCGAYFLPNNERNPLDSLDLVWLSSFTILSSIDFALIYSSLLSSAVSHTDINKFTIKGIADRVWNANLDKYEGLRGSDHRFRVNQLYCEKHGLRPKQVRQIAMKQYTDEKIGELYDCLLTDNENIKVFKQYGLNITAKTLQRWRKENGISKYRKKGTTPS